MVAESWKHGFANTNSIRLHYVEQGEGPLKLILLDDKRGTLLSWETAMG